MTYIARKANEILQSKQEPYDMRIQLQQLYDDLYSQITEKIREDRTNEEMLVLTHLVLWISQTGTSFAPPSSPHLVDILQLLSTTITLLDTPPRTSTKTFCRALLYFTKAKIYKIAGLGEEYKNFRSSYYHEINNAESAVRIFEIPSMTVYKNTLKLRKADTSASFIIENTNWQTFTDTTPIFTLVRGWWLSQAMPIIMTYKIHLEEKFKQIEQCTGWNLDGFDGDPILSPQDVTFFQQQQFDVLPEP